MSSPVRINDSPTRTATNDAALTKKLGARPTVEMRIPATAGPATLPTLNMTLFSVTALARWWVPTSSETKVWRAGLSSASMTPSRSASLANDCRDG